MIVRLKSNLGGNRIEVSEDATLQEFKALIKAALRVEGHRTALSFDLEGKKVLAPDGATLQALNIKHGTEIFLVGRYEKRVISKPTIDADGILVAPGTTIVRVDVEENAEEKQQRPSSDATVRSSTNGNATHADGKPTAAADTGANEHEKQSTATTTSAVPRAAATLNTVQQQNQQLPQSKQQQPKQQSSIPPSQHQQQAAVDPSDFYYDGMEEDEEQREQAVRAPDRAQSMTLIDHQPHMTAMNDHRAQQDRLRLTKYEKGLRSSGLSEMEVQQQTQQLSDELLARHLQMDSNMRGAGGEAMSLEDFMNDLAAASGRTSKLPNSSRKGAASKYQADGRIAKSDSRKAASVSNDGSSGSAASNVLSKAGLRSFHSDSHPVVSNSSGSSTSRMVPLATDDFMLPVAPDINSAAVVSGSSQDREQSPPAAVRPAAIKAQTKRAAVAAARDVVDLTSATAAPSPPHPPLSLRGSSYRPMEHFVHSSSGSSKAGAAGVESLDAIEYTSKPNSSHNNKRSGTKPSSSETNPPVPGIKETQAAVSTRHSTARARPTELHSTVESASRPSHISSNTQSHAPSVKIASRSTKHAAALAADPLLYRHGSASRPYSDIGEDDSLAEAIRLSLQETALTSQSSTESRNERSNRGAAVASSIRGIRADLDRPSGVRRTDDAVGRSAAAAPPSHRTSGSTAVKRSDSGKRSASKQTVTTSDHIKQSESELRASQLQQDEEAAAALQAQEERMLREDQTEQLARIRVSEQRSDLLRRELREPQGRSAYIPQWGSGGGQDDSADDSLLEMAIRESLLAVEGAENTKEVKQQSVGRSLAPRIDSPTSRAAVPTTSHYSTSGNSFNALDVDSRVEYDEDDEMLARALQESLNDA